MVGLCPTTEMTMTDQTDRHIDLSVVLPFRNERENLPELLDRLHATLDPLELSYELIFVDDGSTDDGAAVVEQRARLDVRIKLLVLSRSFGQHFAATAGIDAAQGDGVLWMDADLQERPEDIPRFLAKYREGFDIVYARRRRRRQSPWRAAMSRTFLAVANRMVGFDVASNHACMRLFSAQVAQSLRALRERNRYMAYLMAWMGYRTAEIEIEVDPRRRGRTNYSWLGLMRMGLTGLTSFTVAPLRISAFCSCLAFMACIAGVIWVLYRYFAHGFGVSGWATLVILLLGFHGLQFAVLAILGEYVGVTYSEVKQRPLYFCSRAINLDPHPGLLGMPSQVVRRNVVPGPADAASLETPTRQPVASKDAAPPLVGGVAGGASRQQGRSRNETCRNLE